MSGKLIGADAFINKLTRMRNLAGVESAVQTQGEELRNEVAKNAPVRTGKLRDSFKVEQTGAMAITVTSDLPYDVDQEYGTRFQSGKPHYAPAVASARASFPSAVRKAMGK